MQINTSENSIWDLILKNEPALSTIEKVKETLKELFSFFGKTRIIEEGNISDILYKSQSVRCWINMWKIEYIDS